MSGEGVREGSLEERGGTQARKTREEDHGRCREEREGRR